jgi:small-conductance mechanosensitive channel
MNNHMKSFTQKIRTLVKALALMWLVIICTACSTATSTPPMQTQEIPAEATDRTPSVPTAEIRDQESETSVEIATLVAARTAVPSPTPGPIEQLVDEFVQDTGLESQSFLGLTAEDWINLGISVLVVIFGYWVGIGLLSRILRWFVNRTDLKFDDSFAKHILPELKLLVLLYFSRFAILRLDFLSDEFKIVVEDVFFILHLSVITVIAIRLINFGTQWYKKERLSGEEQSRLRPVITVLNRAGLFAVFVIALSIGLSYFGVNISALLLTVIIVGAIISFGARNIISDVISGFIILSDQPFRVNDGLFISEMETWGDVLDIGTLTTRILTVDNREIIIPNTKLVTNKIVNYTYPDPNFRMQVDLGIAFGSDLIKARQVITDALKKVDYIVPEKKIEVLFIGFGKTNRQVRVRWWTDDYRKQWVVLNEVCTAIETALTEANIEMPFSTYNLNVSMKPDKYE